jgi:3-phenylpropionate/trans-cinnamate dioxygenase ferredoxin reductase subunit
MEDVAYAIIGGGVAAATAIDGIRAQDATGRIAVFTSEWAPPYQRPPLSKEYLRGEASLDSVLMHTGDWYLGNAVDLHVGVTVTAVSPSDHTLQIGKYIIRYGKLLFATGATPRRLSVPGSQLDGIFRLRTYGDSERLRAVRASANEIVIVGSGFIGMELAASLRSGGANVTLTSPDKALWSTFGEGVAAHVAAVFERHGVTVVLNNNLSSFVGDGRVRSVVTAIGTYPCDAVIVGIGVTPNVDLAIAAGLAVENGIIVNDRLQTSHPDIYAAGDVARFPSITGGLTRVEHIDNADNSGRHAGRNMAGADAAYRYVPFFWSDVFELGFEFVGSPSVDSQLVKGSVDSGSFVIEYRRNGQVIGAFLANRTSAESAAYRARL